MDPLVLGTTAVGIVGNGVLLWILLNNPPSSRLTRALTHMQFSADFLSCLMQFMYTLMKMAWPTTTTVLPLQPGPYWNTLFLCYLWKTQISITMPTYFGVNNLMCLAMDRYWAICKATIYRQNHGRCIAFCVIFNLIGALEPLTVFPLWRLVETSGNLFICGPAPQFLYTQIIPGVWLLVNYITPSTTLIVIYSLITVTMNKNRRIHITNNNAPIAACSRRLSKQMTNLLIANFGLAVLFITCFGWARIGAFIGQLGLVSYNAGSAQQYVGIYLSTVYSCLSPVVYTLLFTTYRQKVIRTLCTPINIVRGRKSNGVVTTSLHNQSQSDTHV